MSSEEVTEEEPEAPEGERSAESREVRERLGAGRERAVEGFDEGVIDLLSWVLDTETRAKIYIHLRKHPDSTSDEVAEGTGLYPSTVREALAELHEEGTLERGKRESGGAGNNPYEYRAIPPSALVRGAIQDVQDSLNAVFQLDRYVGGEETGDEEPVTITVEDADETDEETDDWGEAPSDRAMADETDAEPDETALSIAESGAGGADESDEPAAGAGEESDDVADEESDAQEGEESTEEDDVDHSDATVDEDLADQDEEAVEAGEAAEAKAEGGTEGESQEAAGDDEEDQDEDIEESL